jgi:hypothetical protein
MRTNEMKFLVPWNRNLAVKLNRHSGQAGDSFSLRLIRLWRKRAGFQEFQYFLDGN